MTISQLWISPEGPGGCPKSDFDLLNILNTLLQIQINQRQPSLKKNPGSGVVLYYHENHDIDIVMSSSCADPMLGLNILQG